MNELKIFEFEHVEIRTVLIDGVPWFVAKDVADVLGYDQTSNMIKLIRPNDVMKIKSSVLDGLTSRYGNNDIIVINESGLYTAALKSKKPEAVDFQQWVTSEVIPSIRKTGQYSSVANQIPQTYGQLVIAYGQSLVEIERKDAILVEQKHKVDSYHSLMDSRGHINLADVAKIISETVHFQIGRNILMRILRYAKVLNDHNVPFQSYMNRGLFDVVASNPNEIGLTKTTLVTAKGIDFIRNLILGYSEQELGKASGSPCVVKAIAKYNATDIMRNRRAVIPIRTETVEEIAL